MPVVVRLEEQGMFLRTSSWKFLGWRGTFYDEERYVYRGKFARAL